MARFGVMLHGYQKTNTCHRETGLAQNTSSVLVSIIYTIGGGYLLTLREQESTLDLL
jgi:hypothetical protein